MNIEKSNKEYLKRIKWGHILRHVSLMSMGFKNFFKTHLGLIILGLYVLFALIRKFFFLSHHGHYELFRKAAEVLLAGGSPYGISLHPIGLYFYTPLCTIVLFGWLLFFSKKIALMLHLSLAAAFFLYSVLKVSYRFLKNPQFFLIWIGGPLMVALTAFKVEVFMIGGAFLALYFMLSKRFQIGMSMLAFFVSWKFQLFPVFLLFTIIVIFREKSIKACLAGSLVLILCFLFPFLFWPKRAFFFYERELQTLMSFSKNSYLHFENIYTFLFRVFGLHLSYNQGMVLGFLFGCFFALIILYLSKKYTFPRKKLYLLAFALGSLHVVCFSPLQQNNATILLAGTAFLHFYFYEHTDFNFKKKYIFLCLLLSWFLLLFAYSDLLPHHLEQISRFYKIKVIAYFLLFLPVFLIDVKQKKVFVK